MAAGAADDADKSTQPHHPHHPPPQEQQHKDPPAAPSPASTPARALDKDYSHYLYAPVYTGLLGTGMGTALGAWRGHSPLLYALHLGIGYGVFGATFSSTLYGLERVRGKEDTFNWVGAGAAAGAVTSFITAGPKQVVRGAVFFGGLGLVAEAVCDAVGSSFDEYKDNRAKQRFGHPPEARKGERWG